MGTGSKDSTQDKEVDRIMELVQGAIKTVKLNQEKEGVLKEQDDLVALSVAMGYAGALVMKRKLTLEQMGSLIDEAMDLWHEVSAPMEIKFTPEGEAFARELAAHTESCPTCGRPMFEDTMLP